MKLKVEVDNDARGRMDRLTVFRRGRKRLNLQFIYGAEDVLTGIEVDGKRADMPTIMDIVDLTNVCLRRMGQF